MQQEERLSMELEKRKLEGIRDEKMRQQIRETRYELRHEKKLKISNDQDLMQSEPKFRPQHQSGK